MTNRPIRRCSRKSHSSSTRSAGSTSPPGPRHKTTGYSGREAPEGGQMAETALLTLSGAMQGAVPGDGPAGEIECVRFELRLAAKLDAAGHPTSGRHYDPLLITKRLDGASPKLTQALLTGETVQGSFKFFRQDAGIRQHF